LRDGVDPRLVVRPEILAVAERRAALAGVVELVDAALLQRDNVRALLTVDGAVVPVPK
jgi:hypothetical protein